MKPEIKKRIEELNRGKIPKGYKKTEFGVFPCDWKLISLKELLDFKNGVNADKEKYNSGVKMISVMDILKERPITYDQIQGQVNIDEKTLKEFDVTYGDILFQRSSETFEDAGKSNVYLDHEKTATYSCFVIRGKKKAEYNPYYLNEALSIKQVRKQIICRAAGSQHINVGQESLAKITVPIASHIEQSRIAEILMKWDKAIELYEKQIEALKKLKTAYLSVMFPKKGETTPKYRFKGFTDPWEQRELDSLIREKRDKTTTENEDTLLSCAIDGVFLNSELFSHFRGSSNIGYLKVKKYDLILSAQNLHLGNCNVNLRFENGIISPAYKTYELIGCNPYFIQAWVKQDATKDFFLRATTEGASACRKNVVWEELYKQTLFVPKYDEQAKIGAYFDNLDNLITLHQRKLETASQQRKVLQHYLLNGIVRV